MDTPILLQTPTLLPAPILLQTLTLIQTPTLLSPTRILEISHIPIVHIKIPPTPTKSWKLQQKSP